MTNTIHHPTTSKSYLTLLKQKLSKLAGAWTIDDYHSLITFYSSFVPSLMGVERCTVFIMELGSNEICSIFGTGLEHQKIKPPLRGSIVGSVIESGKGYLINDIQEHSGYHSYIEEQTGFIYP